MNTDKSKALIDLLVIRKRLMTLYYQATQKMDDVIQGENFERFEKLIYQKSKIIEEWTEFEETYKQLVAEICTEYNLLTILDIAPTNSKHSIEIREYINEIENLKSLAFEMELKNKNIANEKLGEYQNKLKKVNAGKKVIGGYAFDRGQSGSAFIDIKR